MTSYDGVTGLAARPARRRSAQALLVAALAGLLALTGCAQVPTEGPVGTTSPLPGATSAPNYRFSPPGPSPEAGPEEIIRGFLAAGSGIQDDYATAREFLTGEAAERWEPDSKTLVYTSQPTVVPVAEENTFTVQFEVESIVNADGTRTRNQPNSSEAVTVQLERVDGQWRISGMTEGTGTMLEASQFEVLFASYRLYFFDPTHQYAVPDVRFFLNRPGTAAALVEALLDGPAPYLRSSVATAFPPDASLSRESVPVSSGVARVDLDAASVASGDAAARQRMQQQLELTLGDLSTVSSVEVTTGGASIEIDDGEQVEPAVVEPDVGSTQIAVSGDQLVYYQASSAVAIGGLPDTSGFAPVDPAMSMDGRDFAFLDGDRQRLVTADTDGALQVIFQGVDLTRPSMDSSGWIWTVDHREDPVVMATGSGGDQREITAEWMSSEPVQALRISPDGARAAIISGEGDAARLFVAGVIRDSAGVPRGLDGPLPLDVTVPISDVNWYSEDQLVVAATSTSEAVEAEIVGLDGETTTLSPLLAMTGTSAGPGDNPIYAETPEHVFMRLGGSVWRQQEGQASDLAFPG